jgi:isoleucyl-tRNA synthetase
MFNPINEEGRFTEQVPDFAGQWFKDADKEINRAIKEKNRMYHHDVYVHNYPFDWRKGTPLMSYPVESWFIRTTAVKDKMVELNKILTGSPRVPEPDVLEPGSKIMWTGPFRVSAIGEHRFLSG